MASKLISLASHEAPSQLEFSLREAYTQFQYIITAPLKLTISPSQEYLKLTKAIVYGVLCEPTLFEAHIKYLHAVVNDGYASFINLLCQIVDGLFSKLLSFPKTQLIWVAFVMIDVCAIGFDNLLVSLLRQIVGGDFSDGNLWLSYEMVTLFSSKWDLILDEEPQLLSSALYTYLRLLADHYRLPTNSSSVELKRKEIEFCVRMFREQFHLCLRIGRDLVRLLQNLVHIPEIRVIWKDLLLNPSAFGTSGFSDISDAYERKTPSEFFVIRITPEMETQLRFLLTHVKLGFQKRHQVWFARKFLFVPERETLICDIVRFICCAHHPSKEVLQSDVVPRWAVIGWLLKLCTKKYVEANVKLALFYDWMFFDEKVDNFMNIEPAMLLLVNSIPRYVDITNSLLEFLFLVVENYDMDRKTLICKGVSSAISMLVRKGVISTIDVLTSCNLLSPVVKEMFQSFMFKVQFGISKKPQLPKKSSDMPSQSSPNPSGPETPVQSSDKLPAHFEIAELSTQDLSLPKPMGSSTSCSAFKVTIMSQVDDLAKLIGKIGELMKSSRRMGLQLVENILLFLISHGNEENFGGFSPEFMACELKKELQLGGYKLFSPLENFPDCGDVDDEVQSVSATIIRAFVISQHRIILEMLIWWSRKDCLVGVRLLSYALRLALEAREASCGDYEIVYTNMPLLKFHIEGYISLTSRNGDYEGVISSPVSKVDKKLVSNMISDAFTSYRKILHAGIDLSGKMTMVPGKLLSVDVVSCSSWKKKSFEVIFGNIFSYLPDISRSDEDVIQLLVSQLDDADLVSIQIDLGLKRFAIFGEDVEKIFKLIKKSISWNLAHQYKFWGLIRSELIVSKFPVEKLLLDCFFSIDFELNGIAVRALMALCSSCAPTPEVVGAVMLLPTNKFPDFAAAILSHWTVTNESMFSKSLIDFLNKFKTRNGNAPLINQSAVLFLLEYYGVQGVQGIDMLETLAFTITDVKSGVENPNVPMDAG